MLSFSRELQELQSQKGILMSFYIFKLWKPLFLNYSHLHEEVANPSQTVGDARFGLSQPVVVRDADVVHVFKKGVLSREHQFIQTFWTRLLHSLKTELNIDGKFLQNEEDKSKPALWAWHLKKANSWFSLKTKKKYLLSIK